MIWKAIWVVMVSKRCQLGSLFSFLLRRTLRGSYNLVKYWLWEIFYYFYCCRSCRGEFIHLIYILLFPSNSLESNSKNQLYISPSNQAFIRSQIKYIVSIVISILCGNTLVTLAKDSTFCLLFELTRFITIIILWNTNYYWNTR